MTYTIYYDFKQLNEVIRIERGNRYNAAKLKKDETSVVQYALLNKKQFNTPCKIKFTWLIKNKRIDPDNRAYSKKSVLDGMVKAKIIPDDTHKHILGFVDEFEISDKVGVRIERID